MVGALLFVGNRWRGDAMGARRLASAPAGAEGVSDAGESRLQAQAQGDLAETGADQPMEIDAGQGL